MYKVTMRPAYYAGLPLASSIRGVSNASGGNAFEYAAVRGLPLGRSGPKSPYPNAGNAGSLGPHVSDTRSRVQGGGRKMALPVDPLSPASRHKAWSQTVCGFNERYQMPTWNPNEPALVVRRSRQGVGLWNAVSGHPAPTVARRSSGALLGGLRGFTPTTVASMRSLGLSSSSGQQRFIHHRATSAVGGPGHWHHGHDLPPPPAKVAAAAGRGDPYSARPSNFVGPAAASFMENARASTSASGSPSPSAAGTGTGEGACCSDWERQPELQGAVSSERAFIDSEGHAAAPGQGASKDIDESSLYSQYTASGASRLALPEEADLEAEEAESLSAEAGEARTESLGLSSGSSAAFRAQDANDLYFRGSARARNARLAALVGVMRPPGATTAPSASGAFDSESRSGSRGIYTWGIAVERMDADEDVRAAVQELQADEAAALQQEGIDNTGFAVPAGLYTRSTGGNSAGGVMEGEGGRFIAPEEQESGEGFGEMGPSEVEALAQQLNAHRAGSRTTGASGAGGFSGPGGTFSGAGGSAARSVSDRDDRSGVGYGEPAETHSRGGGFDARKLCGEGRTPLDAEEPGSRHGDVNGGGAASADYGPITKDASPSAAGGGATVEGGASTDGSSAGTVGASPGGSGPFSSAVKAGLSGSSTRRNSSLSLAIGYGLDALTRLLGPIVGGGGGSGGYGQPRSLHTSAFASQATESDSADYHRSPPSGYGYKRPHKKEQHGGTSSGSSARAGKGPSRGSTEASGHYYPPTHAHDMHVDTSSSSSGGGDAMGLYDAPPRAGWVTGGSGGSQAHCRKQHPSDPCGDVGASAYRDYDDTGIGIIVEDPEEGFDAATASGSAAGGGGGSGTPSSMAAGSERRGSADDEIREIVDSLHSTGTWTRGSSNGGGGASCTSGRPDSTQARGFHTSTGARAATTVAGDASAAEGGEVVTRVEGRATSSEGFDTGTGAETRSRDLGAYEVSLSDVGTGSDVSAGSSGGVSGMMLEGEAEAQGGALHMASRETRTLQANGGGAAGTTGASGLGGGGRSAQRSVSSDLSARNTDPSDFRSEDLRMMVDTRLHAPVPGEWCTCESFSTRYRARNRRPAHDSPKPSVPACAVVSPSSAGRHGLQATPEGMDASGHDYSTEHLEDPEGESASLRAGSAAYDQYSVALLL